MDSEQQSWFWKQAPRHCNDSQMACVFEGNSGYYVCFQCNKKYNLLAAGVLNFKQLSSADLRRIKHETIPQYAIKNY